MKVVFLSPTSITVELENHAIYYAPERYDVYLNGQKVLSNYEKNVFSLFNLSPDTKY